MAVDPNANIRDEHVPHEGAQASATDAQMRRTSDHAAIGDVTATPIVDAGIPGAAYVEAEVVALHTEIVALNARLALAVAAVNEVLDVLRDAELIPASS